jgi:hypothetical protein
MRTQEFLRKVQAMPVAVGDRVVVNDRSAYPANIGKQMIVRALRPKRGEIEATPINARNRLIYSDRYCNHMEIGPGETAVIALDQITAVA